DIPIKRSRGMLLIINVGCCINVGCGSSCSRFGVFICWVGLRQADTNKMPRLGSSCPELPGLQARDERMQRAREVLRRARKLTIPGAPMAPSGVEAVTFHACRGAYLASLLKEGFYRTRKPFECVDKFLGCIRPYKVPALGQPLEPLKRPIQYAGQLGQKLVRKIGVLASIKRFRELKDDKTRDNRCGKVAKFRQLI